MEKHLSTLSDAFCGAYAENDCFTLHICVDFLLALHEDFRQLKDRLQENLINTIKQLFCVADFAEGMLFCSFAQLEQEIIESTYDNRPFSEKKLFFYTPIQNTSLEAKLMNYLVNEFG